MVNSKGNSEDKQKHVLDSYSQIPQFLLNYQISKFSFWIKKKYKRGLWNVGLQQNTCLA